MALSNVWTSRAWSISDNDAFFSVGETANWGNSDKIRVLPTGVKPMTFWLHKCPFYRGVWERVDCSTLLLRFSKTRELWSSKVAFINAFSAAVNHNYDHKQRTLKQRNTQNRSKSTNHKSQTMTFWARWSKLLFPKRSAEIIDGSEKRKGQLRFELQNSRVFEKRGKKN